MPSRAARIVNAVLGGWLLLSAFVWHHAGVARANTAIAGAIVLAAALVALRAPVVRWVNTAVAAWVFLAVWVLPHANVGTRWNNAVLALFVFFVSIVPGDEEAPGAERAHRTTA